MMFFMLATQGLMRTMHARSLNQLRILAGLCAKRADAAGPGMIPEDLIEPCWLKNGIGLAWVGPDGKFLADLKPLSEKSASHDEILCWVGGTFPDRSRFLVDMEPVPNASGYILVYQHSGFFHYATGLIGNSIVLAVFLSVFFAGVLAMVLHILFFRPLDSLLLDVQKMARDRAGRLGKFVLPEFNRLSAGINLMVSDVEQIRDSYRARTGNMSSVNLKLDRKVFELRSMNRMMQKMVPLLEKDRLPDLIVDVFCEITSSRKGFLIKPVEDAGQIIEGRIVAVRNLDTDLIGRKYVISTLDTVDLMNLEESFYTDDIEITGEFMQHLGLSPMAAGALLILPLRVDARFWGFVILFHDIPDSSGRRLSETGVLGELSAAAALALENAVLYEQAVTDQGSGLANRLYFHVRVEHELLQNRKRGFDMSILVIRSRAVEDGTLDDELKQDQVVRTGEIMLQAVRQIDSCARIDAGGFAIMLPRTDGSGAMNVARRLARLLDSDDILHSVKYCIGLSVCGMDEKQDADVLIDHAETAVNIAFESADERIIAWDSKTGKQE